MARLLPSVRGESEAAEPTLDVAVGREDSTRRRGLRKVALGLGVLALAYVVSRRAGSGETAPDELRERASEALPTGEAESSGEPESGAEIVERMQGGEGDGAAGAEPIAEYLSGGGRSDERSGELTDERSEELIEERTEEDAHEDPAEPGEMHVDEDVVGEVMDGDEESG